MSKQKKNRTTLNPVWKRRCVCIVLRQPTTTTTVKAEQKAKIII